MRFVFLPGLDGTGLLFEPLLKIWNDAKPPIVISYPTNHFLDYSELEIYVRPQFPRREPYILVAESFGGPLAIRIAAHQPAFLKGLVLSATFVRQPRGLLGAWSKSWIRPIIFSPAF